MSTTKPSNPQGDERWIEARRLIGEAAQSAEPTENGVDGVREFCTAAAGRLAHDHDGAVQELRRARLVALTRTAAVKVEAALVAVRSLLEPRPGVQDLVSLAALCLRFSRVERATRHEDGKRPETDSDHTVMLGVIACACAEKVAPSLDLGKIAQFATVHDLIEAYAGDVLSLGMSAEVRASKEARERAALERVRVEFLSVPWLAATIDAYEARATPEARFVKILDKVMPKLTHLLNGGAALREHGFSFEKAHADHLSQRAMMATEYPQAEALALFDLVIAECARAWGMAAASPQSGGAAGLLGIYTPSGYFICAACTTGSDLSEVDVMPGDAEFHGADCFRCGEEVEPDDAPQSGGADTVRGDNWTPPADDAPCFEAALDEGSPEETCLHCGKRIGQHFGGTEYRCAPAKCIGRTYGNDEDAHPCDVADCPACKPRCAPQSGGVPAASDGQAPAWLADLPGTPEIRRLSAGLDPAGGGVPARVPGSTKVCPACGDDVPPLEMPAHLLSDLLECQHESTTDVLSNGAKLETCDECGAFHCAAQGDEWHLPPLVKWLTDALKGASHGKTDPGLPTVRRQP